MDRCRVVQLSLLSDICMSIVMYEMDAGLFGQSEMICQISSILHFLGKHVPPRQYKSRMMRMMRMMI
jgi:hypothetical protein